MKLQYASFEALSRLVDDLRLLEAGRLSASEIESSPLLYNHRVVPLAVGCLTGVVDGHPNLRSGREITTSQIFFIDSDRGIARTLSRWYRIRPSAQAGGH